MSAIPAFGRGKNTPVVGDRAQCTIHVLIEKSRNGYEASVGDKHEILVIFRDLEERRLAHGEIQSIERRLMRLPPTEYLSLFVNSCNVAATLP